MPGDWIEIPEVMLSEVLRLIDPVPEHLTSAGLRYKNAVTDVNRSLIEALVEYLEGGELTCDHAVNICNCGPAQAHYELKLLLDGKLVCRQCGGEGFVWDQAHYDAEVAKYAAWSGVTEGEIRAERDDDAGNIQCPTCKGAGVTRAAESG